LLTFSGCSLLQKLGLQKGSQDELRPVSSIVMDEAAAQALSDKVPIHLYFANEDNTKLKLEVRYISIADAKQSTSHLASVIVNELIKGPTAGNGCKATIPAGTKLRNSISISSGIATVDLSKEFKTKHPGGKDAEKMTIYSIVNSLTELTDIQKVKFTIAGKVEKEYMGNFQFNAPFPRTTSLISKDAGDKTSESAPADDKATSGKTGGSIGDSLEMLE
jgi:spore germination protein GerM